MSFKAVCITERNGNIYFSVERKGIYGFDRTTVDCPRFATLAEARRYADELNRNSEDRD